MRKRFRIFSTLTAMVLVVIVMCVGIWAASQATISGSDGILNVSPQTDNVFATVKVDFQNKGTFTNGGQNEQTFSFDASNTEPATQTILLPKYSFELNDNVVSFVVTVHNDSTNESSNLSADLSVNVTGTNESLFEVTIKENSNLTLGADAEGTFTVEIKYIGNYSNADEANYNFNLTLSESAQ